MLIRGSIRGNSQIIAEKEPYGFLDWYRIMRSITDEDLKVIFYSS